MSGLSQIINTGWTGLNAASQALETISNNTANVNTPGYNVESVQQSEVPSLPGQNGLGVQVNSIQRSFDQFVFGQMVSANSANEAAQTTQNSMDSLGSIFPIASGGAGGLSASITSFFSGIAGVTQDPTSLPNRQSFLSAANALAENFNSVGNQLASMQTSLNGQLTNAVSQVNSLAQQIAVLNGQIEAQTATGGAGPPNTLMDSRDNLVQQLGSEVGITIVAGPYNTDNIFTAGGAVLVQGSTASNLAAASGSYGGGGSLSVIYQPTGQNITANLSGGTIGGILASQAQVTSTQDSVGALAVALTQAINQQQSLGLDLNGALGQNLLNVGGPTVHADTSNSGSGTLNASITNTNSFVPGDFIVAKTASGYQATNTATGQVTALGSGPTLSLDGMTLTVSGTINVGDSFAVQPTATAAQTLAVATTNPNLIAAASPYVATPGSNLGNVTASAFSAAASGSLPTGTVVVPSSYFGQNLSVKFTSATSFNVLSASNTVIASGSFSATNGAEIAVAYPGSAGAGEVAEMSLSAGTPAAGDTFSLAPGGVASNGNAQAMAGLANQNLLSGETLINAYVSLVGQVGSAGQTATFTAQATQGVLSQVQSVQQSISGVNLDQQAANLISFQQAYQASAQVISSASQLFQSLLSAVQAR